MSQRVHARTNQNICGNEQSRRELKDRLLTEAAQRLATEVVTKTRRLANARPPEPPLSEPAPALTVP